MAHVRMVLPILLAGCYYWNVNAVGDDTPLLEQLLSDLGCGGSTCKKVGSLARAALMPPTSALREVAEAVTGKNSERSLHRWANTQIWWEMLPQTYEFGLRIQNRCLDELVDATHSALLPHVKFSIPYMPTRQRCFMSC